MPENLRSILRGLDFGRSIWKFTEIELWPEGELEHCIAQGLFVPDEPSEQVPCRQCGELADVHLSTSPLTAGTAGLSCECGPDRVPLLWVSCWRLAFSRFQNRLSGAIGIDDNWHEVVRDRVWRLGKWHVAGASRNVYMARQLRRVDTFQVFQQARFPAGSVVFVPSQMPSPELRIEPVPMLIPLVDVLRWDGDGFALDKAHVEDQLRAAADASDDNADVRKRDSRFSAIGLLKQELVEHLRSARDYAVETRQRRGTPELLPRPTREQLAKRAGVHRTTVTRCLEDGSAPELLSLWNLAADLDQILAYGT